MKITRRQLMNLIQESIDENQPSYEEKLAKLVKQHDSESVLQAAELADALDIDISWAVEYLLLQFSATTIKSSYALAARLGINFENTVREVISKKNATENVTIDHILHGIDDIVINSQNTIIQSVFGINGSELESMVYDENLYMEIDMDLVLGTQNYAKKAIENSIVQMIVAIAKSG